MTYVIGIDPGPTPGIVGLQLDNEEDGSLNLWNVDVVQCSVGTTLAVLDGLDVVELEWLAIEAWAMGARSARSATPTAGRITRDLIERCRAWADDRECQFIERRATDVKAWATDHRLSAAKLLDPTKGMTHARDAARHALYAAVKDCGLRDPLSRKGVA